MVGEIVKPSGAGRTATWENIAGTVTRVTEGSVFVQWHNCAVEDEWDFEEVVSTHTFNEKILNHARVLGGEQDWKLLLTFYDGDDKESS